MTIHILCTARRRGSVTLGPFTYCVKDRVRVAYYGVPLNDGVGAHYDHSHIVYR